MHLYNHSWHSCTLRNRIRRSLRSLWTAWTLECLKCHMPIQIENKASRFQEIRFLHNLPEACIDFRCQDWIQSWCTLLPLYHNFQFDWKPAHSTACQSTLRIFNLRVLNSAKILCLPDDWYGASGSLHHWWGLVEGPCTKRQGWAKRREG